LSLVEGEDHTTSQKQNVYFLQKSFYKPHIL
jgi:hypothetical protein